MKQALIILTIAITLFAPSLVLAGSSAADTVNPVPDCGNGSAAGSPDVCGDVGNQQGNNGTNSPIIKIIKAAIDILSFIIGAAAIIGIVVSGIRLTVSGGDSQAVASARSGLLYSLIGVAAVAIAQVLVVFVLDNVK